MIDSAPPVAPRRRHVRHWLALALALAVSVVARIPLIENADVHLDSDLAVDGLTLRDALEGGWRWHFPGTPHIGSAPLVIAWPVATLMGGDGPRTLAATGTVVNGCLIVATFVLALRAFGPRVAAWSMLPLAFASTGTIWLSSRITGGHLLATAWYAGALACFHSLLRHGGDRRGLLFGVVCGLGVWVDSMFLVGLAAMFAAGALAWMIAGPTKRGLATGAVVILGIAIGLAPKVIGRMVDPYDAYASQFETTTDRAVLIEHAKILALDCLPRLVAGHRLWGMQSDPDGFTPDGRARFATRPAGPLPLAIATTALGAAVFFAAFGALKLSRWGTRVDDPGRATAAVRIALVLTSAGVLAAFVLNRAIFNSDNYRYLVFLLPAIAIGAGVFLDGLARKGSGGAVGAGLLAVLFAASFTFDLFAWYRVLGWIDARGAAIVKPLDDPILRWLDDHPETGDLYGEYWDVYRLSYLARGRVVGVPSGHYPDRFPGRGARLPGGRPHIALIRPGPIGRAIRLDVERAGGRPLFTTPEGALYSWP